MSFRDDVLLGGARDERPTTMTGASALPNAKDDDTDDVRWALETANAMWSQGDLREALRWIRRAAETAAGDGLDLRAVELAKTAAALRTELDIPQTMPPPAILANAPPAEAPRAPPAPKFEEPEHEAPPPPAAAAPPPPPPPPPEPAAPPPPPPPAAAAPPPPPPEPTESGRQSQRALGGTMLMSDARGRLGTEPGLSPSQAPPGGTYAALRVAVGRGNDGALTVRRLDPGEPARSDEHDAMLVALSPNARFDH